MDRVGGPSLVLGMTEVNARRLALRPPLQIDYARWKMSALTLQSSLPR